MNTGDSREDRLREVNEALASWWQGDCSLGDAWFVFRLEPSLPLTRAVEEAASDGETLAEAKVHGFAVLTQTCDIVRPCKERPFVEVAPLVEVNNNDLVEIRRGYRPQYAYIPGVADQNLVADLDRVMTVEKTVVARWERKPGCSTDEEVRAFAQAVSRKRARFAFPDDFTEFAGPLQDRIKKKHGKYSPEGEALRALREIRVLAKPSWEAKTIKLLFYFIRNIDEVTFQGRIWSDFLDKWLVLVPEKGRYTSVDGIVVTHDDITAREYLESDRLDLDHLSLPREG